MTKKQFLKATFLGFLTWLVPLIISFLFYNASGQVAIDQTLFKSIMIVISMLVVVPLLVVYFSKVTSNFVAQAIIIGVWWFIINIALDAIVLLPWLKVDFATYMGQIGLRYLIMPITAIGFGWLLECKTK